MKFGPVCLSFALLFTALTGARAAQARSLEVVASFTVLADVVRQVGGSHVHVTSLVPPNGDPHEFEPSPDDARRIRDADVTFVSGEGLESWFSRLVVASGYRGTPVIASNGIKTLLLRENGHMVTDPHVWNSIPNVEIWVANIRNALSAADPDDAADFRAQAESYTRELEALDRETEARFSAIPRARRIVLTSHDALGYFGDRYGVTFVSPLGVSTETEASAADVAQVIRQIRAEHVKTYFFENSNDARLVRQIAAATGARPGGVLYVEALSPADGPAATYLAMFRYNTDQIVAALGK